MTRLIVTTDSSIAGAIQQAGLADLVIAIERRLVWGPLPSDAELDPFFAPRTTCLLYTSPSPRDGLLSRMPSSA